MILRWLVLPLAWLPLRLAHAIGSALGWLAWAASARYRARLSENLRQSGLYSSESGYRALRRQAIVESGKGFMELFPIWLRDDDAVAKYMTTLDGDALIEDARARGRGIMFLTPHLGCFEIMARYLALRLPITILYRPPRLRWLEPIMRAGRARGHARLATTGAGGVRALLQALRRAESVLLLPDQAPPAGYGVWAPYFGRAAYTMTLATRMQRSTDAEVLIVYAERLPNGCGYRLVFRKPEQPIVDEAALNREIERTVARVPAQYLWSYNRYKVPAGESAPSAAAPMHGAGSS